MIIAIKVLLFPFIFLFVYLISTLIRDLKEQGYLSDVMAGISSKAQIRERDKELRRLLQGDVVSKSFIEKLDNTLDKSGAKMLIPGLTSEYFVITSVLFSLSFSFVLSRAVGSILIGIALFFTLLVIPYLSLVFIALRNYSTVDDYALIFLNTMLNLCGTNNDIVSIVEKSIPFTRQPLKTYCIEFIGDARELQDLDKAFQNFEDKIESIRLKRLLRNLRLCAKHDGNYAAVLQKSRILFRGYMKIKADRRAAVNSARVNIVMTIGICMYTLKMVLDITPNAMQELLKNPFGLGAVVYLLGVAIFSLFKFVSLGKLDI